jgi:hypothetical protein
MTKKDAFTSLINLESERVPRHPFPGRWIDRVASIAWPPRSPNLTPLEFFLWAFVKARVFVALLPANIFELRTRITAAVA